MPSSDSGGQKRPVTDDLTIRRRDLPHWESGGSVYFITFRLQGTHPGKEQASSGVGSRLASADAKPQPAFAPKERQIVLEEALFWHTKKWFVHALVVMPDHVHILAEPLVKEPGVWHPLSEILHSVKRRTAWQINRLRGRRGRLWQSERMDRIRRGDGEFSEKFNYIVHNAQRKELAEDGWEYQWFWSPGKEEWAKRGLK